MDRAEARLSVGAAVPDEEHVGQMGDVAGRQAESLDFGQLSVHGLRGYECPQGGEGGVDALRPASLPGVGRDPLLDDASAAGVSFQFARNPPAFLAGVSVALLRAAVALAAVVVVVGQQGQVGVDQVRRHRPQHGKSHHGERKKERK